MKQKKAARILITLLGISFVLLGVCQIVLGFAGESTSAVITSIRREGGERADGKPGRYTYIISYSFSLPDGKEVHGFTRNIGDSVYMKADGNSITRVRYFRKLPYINVMEADAGLRAGQLVLIITGLFLIYFINQRK